MAKEDSGGSQYDELAPLVDLLVQTSFEVIALLTKIGAEHDLSLTQVRMLGILRDRTLKMAELADFLGLERSTVSGLVDRAERKGLVLRKRSAGDGRSTELTLTPAGQQLAGSAARQVTARIAPIVADLPIRHVGAPVGGDPLRDE